jgi:holliday junction DNA helicase RuvA
MITFLEGQMVEKSPARLVINVGGVGYEVFIPLSSYDRLPAAGQVCRILVYEYIREDQHSLFGFMTEQERKTFVALMSVNGIGPKLAMSALSSLAVSELIAAIVAGDVGRLTTIAGVGRKIAERMALELRDKLAAEESAQGAGGAMGGPNVKSADAILALISLGYKQNEATKMVAAIAARESAEMSVEEIVRRALRR